jgi:hypothetical protein
MDLAEIFDPDLFNKLQRNIKLECPTISNVLEQLVLSPNASRNTIPMKMKAAVHVMSCPSAPFLANPSFFSKPHITQYFYIITPG